MFKFVVLCAFVAAASATPGALIAPLSYSAPAVLPAPALYSSYPGNYVYSPSVVSAAPLTYSSPFGYAHLIKKRSAPLAVSSYIAPSPYFGSAPLVNSWNGAYAGPYATTYTAAGPVVSTPYYSTAPLAYSHFIKKRSAPLAIAAYSAPSFSHQSRLDYQATSPAITTSYTSYPSPLVYSSPLGISHFI